jgi:dolichol-phosphate mannosyltransferase
MPANPASRRHAPPLSWQAISFAAIGLSGTAITFVILTMLHKGLGWKIAFANIPAYSAGIVNNYAWNRLWTFRHVEHKNVLHQGSQFVLVSVGGLIINTIVLTLVAHSFDFRVAFVIAAGVAFFWNFGANHQLTFRHKAPVALHALSHPHIPHHHSEAVTLPIPSDAD